MFDQDNRRLIRPDNVVNTKSRHLIIMNNLKKKEENWNNRFYVHQARQNDSLDKCKVNQSLTQKLYEVQNQHNIPDFHRELFKLCLKTLPKQQQAIQFELEEMQNKKAHVQLCMQAIEAREKCLQSLNYNIQLINDDPSDENLIQKSAEFITHLRILSINIVEQVVGWRQYLMKFLVNIHSEQSIQLPFIYQRENYLYKMKRDVHSIQNSILNQFYSFSNKQDPFFVAITKPAEDVTKIVQYISKPLLKRIKNCESILLDENSFLKDDSKSIHKQQNSKDSIRNSPEKGAAIQAGRIRPKRPQPNRQVIPQMDIIDYTELKMSPPKASAKVEAQEVERNQVKSKVQSKRISQIKQNNQIVDQQQQQEQQQQQQQQQNVEIQNQKQIEQQIVQVSESIEQQKGEIRIIKSQLTDKEVIQYLQDISQDFTKSNRASLDYMQQQYDQNSDSFCLSVIKGKMIGFAQCHLDGSLSSERRLILSHFSTLNYDDFKDILTQILNIFWNCDSCMEIRTLLYHYHQNDSFEANKDLTRQLKELGFKWKVVQSVNAEIRFTVMGIRRPQGITPSNQFDPIFLQHMYFSGNSSIQERNTLFQSIVCQCYIGEDIKLENELFNGLKTLLKQSEYQYRGIKKQIHNQNEFLTYFKEQFQGFEGIINPSDYQISDEITSCFAKECYRWKKQKLAQQEQILYNHFKVSNDPEKATAFILESTKIPIYLLSTDQSNVNVFIFEYDDEVNLERIQQIFTSCSAQIPIHKDLYVPQFTLAQKVKVQEDLIGVAKFTTYYKPEYVDLPMVNQEALIVKAPFIFGLIVDDFQEMCNYPSLVFKVNKEACIVL